MDANSAVTFAFQTHLDDSEDHEDNEHDGVPYGNSGVIYEADIDNVLARARTLAEQVARLELLAQRQVETSRCSPSEYHARFHELL